MKNILKLVLCLFMISGCANIYEGLSTKTSDDALIEDARKAANDRDWDKAILKMQSVSTDYLAKREIKKFYAGILAGKCGLDFIDFLGDLNNVSLSSTTFFSWLMNVFKDAVVAPDYCRQAELMMMSIATTYSTAGLVEFTSGERLFLMILSMVKIGSYLRAKADVDGAASLGDGTADSTFNACSVADITDDEVKQLVTGLAMLLQTFTAFSASFSADASASLTTISTLCSSLTFCSLIDVNSIDATMIDQMRDILMTSMNNPTVKLGIGTGASAANDPGNGNVFDCSNAVPVGNPAAGCCNL